MNKRQLFKKLSEDFDIKKTKNSSYDFDLVINDTQYSLWVIPVTKNTQVTFNSHKIWELSKGKIDGIRFHKTSKTLLHLNGFTSKENKVVYLTNKPYRKLKYLNESDIIDVSDETIIHDILFIENIEDFNKLIK